MPPQPARHQRRRQVEGEVVLLEAVLVADFDDVAEAFGGEQRGLRALDQHIVEVLVEPGFDDQKAGHRYSGIRLVCASEPHW